MTQWFTYAEPIRFCRNSCRAVFLRDRISIGARGLEPESAVIPTVCPFFWDSICRDGMRLYEPNTPGPLGSGSSRGWGNRGDRGYAHRGIVSLSPGDSRKVLPIGLDHYLLRFFDFTVERGKKYRYRVKLAIADPNYDVATNTLSPEVLDRHRDDAS